jgi:hypothetical protein
MRGVKASWRWMGWSRVAVRKHVVEVSDVVGRKCKPRVCFRKVLKNRWGLELDGQTL